LSGQLEEKTMNLSKLLALCTAALAFNVATAASAQKAAAPATFDINNPDDVVKMDRKIQSSLKDGEEIVYYWEGNVYTRIAGEKDRHFFTYWGMNIRTSKGFQDPVKGSGYRHVSREVLFYRDPVTQQVVRT